MKSFEDINNDSKILSGNRAFCIETPSYGVANIEESETPDGLEPLRVVDIIAIVIDGLDESCDGGEEPCEKIKIASRKTHVITMKHMTFNILEERANASLLLTRRADACSLASQ